MSRLRMPGIRLVTTGMVVASRHGAAAADAPAVKMSRVQTAAEGEMNHRGGSRDASEDISHGTLSIPSALSTNGPR